MELFSKIRSEIVPYFEGENGCHDLEHTERVLKNAVHIAKKEGADLEIVSLAALLHDVGRKEELKLKKSICHAEIGAKIAREILTKHNYPKNKIDKVVGCIETHRFRKNNPPKTIEAKCLFDADKLDSIGAVGIGRAYMFAGGTGAKLHNKKGVIFTPDQELGPEDTAFREFSVKLKHIKDKMYTKEGKKLSKERHKFMEKFFHQMEKEIEGKL
ncbi:MAG: HD domain-containing protein [Candidatus Diapherotrites archaeon]|uniref:HD domain-containing protein n=1 Tax=Candidatus Iainarchaeum sp. TaxID=3101447 RepID=A0A7K4BZD1_9ARCH|nr:HD domain-containing protein [Candidatus Diapherotrites archaeon]